MCVADNQSAKRYNNVPGGKIYFFSHQNFFQTMKFLIGIIPVMSAQDFNLSEATVAPDQVVEAILADPRTEAQENLVKMITNREGDQSLLLVQKAQVELKLIELGIDGTPTFPADEATMDEIASPGRKRC
jgi:hypothetical protein